VGICNLGTMAEQDGQKEFVEGFDSNGKPLERITKSQTLQEQQRLMKKEEVELNNILQKETFEMSELKNRLQECTDKCEQMAQKLSDLRLEQTVELDGEQQSRIITVTSQTIDSFLGRRPRSQDETMMVDVHFLTGTETTGFNLHINGEGAGSRDAKFLVQLNQKVESLATQAAKYWGLDPDKVFFLDRDGRLILDKMNLVDVILPPVPRTSASSTPPMDEGTDALAVPDGETQENKDLWMVKGRNYCLTLVRASTVLSKEDLNRPKGQKWEDFTFNEQKLEQELEHTRKKRRGEEGEANKMNSMDAIPSLNDLMHLSLEKKRKKRLDMRCRAFEFLVFFSCMSFYCLSFLLAPNANLSLFLQRMGLVNDLSRFTQLDNSSSFYLAPLEHRSFSTIQTQDQYWHWLRGPFQRGMLEYGSTANDGDGPVALQAVLTKWEGFKTVDPLEASFFEFCEVPEDNSSFINETETATITQTETTSTATTVSATITSTTSSTSSTTTDPVETSTSTVTFTSTSFTSTSTVTATSTLTQSATTYTKSTMTMTTSTITSSTTSYNTTTTTTAAYGSVACIPLELEPCLNVRVMNVIAKGMESGHQTPVCRPRHEVPRFMSYLSSWTSDQPFSYVTGKVTSYDTGNRSSLLVTNGTQDFEQSLFQAVGVPYSNGNDEVYEFADVAHDWLLIFYLPTMNSLIFQHFIVESTFTGSLKTSTSFDVTPLDPESNEAAVMIILSGLCTILLILMDIRRLLHWPKRLTFEEERTRCSCWSVLILFLPMMIFAELGIALTVDAQKLEVLDVLESGDEGRILQGLDGQFRLRATQNTTMTITWVCFILFLIRYLLLHVGPFNTVAAIAQKMSSSMWAVFLISLCVLFVVGVMLKTAYGDMQRDFSQTESLIITTAMYAMGTFSNWEDLYFFEPTLWTLTSIVVFMAVQLFLNSLPVSLMLSFKKEAALNENYSYHPFWSAQRSSSRDNSNSNNFNPATIGWDFTGKEPQPVIPPEHNLAS